MFKCAFFNPDHSLAKLHTLQSFTPGKYALTCHWCIFNCCSCKRMTVRKYIVFQFLNTGWYVNLF